MTFSEVMEQIAGGGHFARSGWIPPEFLQNIPDGAPIINSKGRPVQPVKTVKNPGVTVYQPTQEEIDATDWEEV